MAARAPIAGLLLVGWARIAHAWAHAATGASATAAAGGATATIGTVATAGTTAATAGTTGTPGAATPGGGPVTTEAISPPPPPPPPAARPRRPPQSLRLQVRANVPAREQVLQATYFTRQGPVAFFANVEAFFVDDAYSHVEHESNVIVTPFDRVAWLAPLGVMGRFTTDYTPYKTVSLGLNLGLTAFAGLRELARRYYFDLFVQCFPLKTDDHYGDIDVLFYYRIPIWKDRLYVRGFSRVYAYYDRRPVHAWFVEDLIVALSRSVDVYLRHSDLEPPRRDGFSVGIRYLFEW